MRCMCTAHLLMTMIYDMIVPRPPCFTAQHNKTKFTCSRYSEPHTSLRRGDIFALGIYLSLIFILMLMREAQSDYAASLAKSFKTKF